MRGLGSAAAGQTVPAERLLSDAGICASNIVDGAAPLPGRRRQHAGMRRIPVARASTERDPARSVPQGRCWARSSRPQKTAFE